MADVQPEDGFTALAHPVVEALARASMPGRHLRVVLAVARLTWGWRKKSDRIGSRQIGAMTGISPGNVRWIIADLLRWRILREAGLGFRGRRDLGIEKDFERWEIADTHDAERRRSRSTSPETSGRPDASEVSGRQPEKASGRPDTSKEKKEIVGGPPPLSDLPEGMIDATRLADLLRSEILRTTPKTKVPSDLARWARELERMVRIDGRSPEEIETTIRWLFGLNLEDEVSFVVLSAEALRRKFDRVSIQMARGPRGLRGRRPSSSGWTRNGGSPNAA